AMALVKKLKIYPLAHADHPPATSFYDVSGKLFDGIVRFDESFYTSLARMVDEEPAFPRDSAMIERLKSLGIEKGRPFRPAAATRAVQREQAETAPVPFAPRAANDGDPFCPARRWRTPSTAGIKTGFTFVTDGKLEVEERARLYFLACAPPKKTGK